MTISSAPLRTVSVVAVLFLALLPLPGALSLWTSVLVGVWVLPPSRPIVAVLADRVIGIVQPLTRRLAVPSRAPPFSPVF